MKSWLKDLFQRDIAKTSQGHTKALFEKQKMVLKVSSLMFSLLTFATKLRQPVTLTVGHAHLFIIHVQCTISNANSFQFSIISRTCSVKALQSLIKNVSVYVCKVQQFL